MARAASLHLVVATTAVLALAGCVEGGKNSGGSATSVTATPASSVRLVDRDVEAPEVFQVTDSGLWDGRPSLGGVWVASSDAKDPERVIIRNQANGKFVIGALFRRERENPGPKLQISSDAAAALGMLAGQPAELNVTALRREEPAAAAPAATAPILDAAETVETETLAATAAAAIDSADASAAAAPVAPAPVEKKRPWWKKKPAEVEAVVVAETDSAAPVATPAATPAAAPAARPAAPAPASGKSLIQLGIFSVEANAKRAADMVTKAGAPAEVRREESKGKAYWRVVAGPAATPADRAALMAKVKGLGFADAYFVAR